MDDNLEEFEHLELEECEEQEPSTDKPSYGLEDIPSMRNIKSRFEGSDANGDDGVSSSGPIKRSESILSKMARFQNLANDNGHYEESESEEEEEDDDLDGEVSVIKETRKKDKHQDEVLMAESDLVSFSGMSELKNQWEELNNGDKERGRERQEEMSKVRMKICHGKNNLRALYEGALQDQDQNSGPRTAFPVEMGTRAQALRQKFETGELEDDEEIDEREEMRRREKEEDLSVVKDPAIATDARHMFKQMDAEVSRGGSNSQATTPSRTSVPDRWSRFSNQSSVSEGEIVRPGDANGTEDVVIETRDVSAKFRFFQNFENAQPERKRFTITPPREPERDGESPERDMARDPNVIRSGEAEEIMVTDTARKMLNKFRELENASEDSVAPVPKPIKRITPPRDFTRYTTEDESEPVSRDPNIVRACDKIEEDFLIQANQAKSLRAKFEHWEDEVDKENRKNSTSAADLDQELQSAEKAKTLRAQFESLQDESNKKLVEKTKPKVNRFVQDMEIEVCAQCEKRVYAMEKIETSGHKYHRSCFKCSQCGHVLRLDNYTTSEGVLYCTPHFMQLFISKGNYDEGFGRGQHKSKWATGAQESTKLVNGADLANGNQSEEERSSSAASSYNNEEPVQNQPDLLLSI